MVRRTERPAFAQVADDVPQRPAGGRVETRRGLVEEDQLRVVHQRECDREALLLAARQLLGPRVAALAEPEQLDQLVGRAGLLVEAAEQVDDLGDGQLRVHRRRLEADPDPRLQLVGAGGDVDAEDHRLTAIGAAEALQDLDRRGLAGAVRPQQAEDLAAGDVEVDAVHRDEVAVVLDQAADADDRPRRDRVDRHQSFLRRYAVTVAS